MRHFKILNHLVDAKDIEKHVLQKRTNKPSLIHASLGISENKTVAKSVVFLR